MAPAVLGLDVEALCVAYLTTAVAARSEPYTDAVRVATEYLGVPGRQVTVTRDGGPRTNVVFERPRLRVNVWAETDPVATDLALMVAALLMAWPGSDGVVSYRQLSGPSAVPDENASRRVLLVEVMIRSVQLTPA